MSRSPDRLIPLVFALFAVLLEGMTLGFPRTSFSPSPVMRIASWTLFGLLIAALVTHLRSSGRIGPAALLAVVAAGFISELAMGFVEAILLRDAELKFVTAVANSSTLGLRIVSGVTIMLLMWAHRAREEALDQERRAAELRARVTHARLELLHRQLHPHFLFNTLNSAATLASADRAACRDMIRRLRLLLRSSLESRSHDEVPLRDELALVRSYVMIEKARFGERLQATFDVMAPAEEQRVPPFLLQPIVENAVRHGIALRAAGGRVEIRAAVFGRRCIVEVEDDGVGTEPSPVTREGIGLSNSRLRLRELYGDDQSITLRRGPLGGMLVEISFPARIA